MQLIWVSGPTGKVVTLSITARTVAWVVLGLCGLMLALGVLFHFIGLRIAVEVSPQVAQAIGGVTSVAEHERLEARYREQLQALQGRVGDALERVTELETARTELLKLLGVRHDGGIPRQPILPRAEAQGGPLRLLEWFDPREPGFERELAAVNRHVALVDASFSRLHDRWLHEGRRLQRLPAGLPLQEPFYMSSTFGIRPDPFTGQRSLHEGVDFVAPVGTPILAAGAGIVRRSEFAGDHGHVVEIEHDEGYLSRYAHLSRRLAQVGHTVQRGDTIGLLGNSGRSTGAHLHFEVEHRGRLIDPNRALAPLAWR